MIAASATPGTRRTRGPFGTDERLLQQHRVGPVDRLPAGGILALLPQLPDWPAATVHRTRRLNGAGTILDWLNAHPGEGWQDRWTVSGADRDTGWIEMLAPGDTRRAVTKRQEHLAGLGCLLMCRAVAAMTGQRARYCTLMQTRRTACPLGDRPPDAPGRRPAGHAACGNAVS